MVFLGVWGKGIKRLSNGGILLKKENIYTILPTINRMCIIIYICVFLSGKN